MVKKALNSSGQETGYKFDRAFRGAKSGAAIGLLFGFLASMLLSRWLPESLFGPVVLTSAALFALLFGLFFPVELSYRELDDDPDSIAPADRVNRLHAESGNRNDSGH